MHLVNRFSDPRPLTRCEVCDSDDYEDRTTHDGRSKVRICRRCERFMGFPVWNGRVVESFDRESRLNRSEVTNGQHDARRAR